MTLSNTINFDNTLCIKNFAKTQRAKNLLNISSGNEKQIANINDIISGEGFGFYQGKIIDIYTQNGFYYYVIKCKNSPRARKTFMKTLRSKDLNIIK